jgi:hypothetical protein
MHTGLTFSILVQKLVKIIGKKLAAHFAGAHDTLEPAAHQLRNTGLGARLKLLLLLFWEVFLSQNT